MRKMILISILVGIFAGNVAAAFAEDLVGCVKLTQADEVGKVECFEVFHQADTQKFKNIQTVIQGSSAGDAFRFIKSKALYHLVQFNSGTGCLSVHRMTQNLEKLETYDLPCGLVPAADVQGIMDQKGNMFLALTGHDEEQDFLGKLTVLKMSPSGEFRIFPVLLNSALHHPQTFRNLKIAVSAYSNTVYVAYVQAGIDDEFGDLHITALDTATGTAKDELNVQFKVSLEGENLQLAANQSGQAFAVVGGINDEGVRGIFSLQEEFAGAWSRPGLIRSGAQMPRLTLLDSDLIYMTSQSLDSSQVWLDLLSGQAKGVINTLNYSEELAMNLASTATGTQLAESPDAAEVLERFPSDVDEPVLIGLERKI